MKLYGIPNCDTVKKARAWLETHAIDYEFHDYKKHGVDAASLAHWMAQVGWEKVLNRQGQTWRKLSEAEKAAVKDEASAIALLLAQPSAIKRPAIEAQGKLILGFDAVAYQNYFGDKQ
jgi:arsenate reductase